MKLQPYIEKLNSSNEYAEFKKEHPKAFLVAGFFVLDMEAGKNVHQIDFFLPGEKKVAAFTLDDQVKIQLMETMSKETPKELDISAKIDLDELKGILEDEMKNRGFTENIKKIIAVIQNIDGKKTWNLNCILSGMEILRAHIEDESKTVLKMDKHPVTDLIKTIPNPTPEKIKAASLGKASKDEINKTIKNLDKLEDEIEKEKKVLKDELIKKDKGKLK
jgi:hypothetical protein